MYHLLFLLLFSISVFAGDDLSKADLFAMTWVYKGTIHGVDLYRQKNEAQTLIAVRGTTIIHAPLENVLSAIVDDSYEKQKRWVANLKEFKVLSKNTLFQRSIYVHVGLPWPVADRDFVYKAVIRVNKEQNLVWIEYATKDDLAPYKEEVVRGGMKTAFILTKLTNNSTKIDLRSIADPRGKIPTMAINIAQKSYSEEMLHKIRLEVENPSKVVVIPPEFVGILNR